MTLKEVNRLPRSFVSAEDAVRQIQNGDNGIREDLIADNLSQIRWMVRKITRTFAAEQSDAFSVALEMFNKAIDRYRPETDVPFQRFAMLIIRNRLIDWVHKERSETQALVFSDCRTGDGTPIEDHLADPRSGGIEESLELEESMAKVEYQLSLFGLSIDGMISRFPKHQDSRLACVRIARSLAGNETLMKQTLASRRLPVSDLARLNSVPVKTIDRNRASIIFLALLIQSDLTLINRYIKAFEMEANDHE